MNDLGEKPIKFDVFPAYEEADDKFDFGTRVSNLALELMERMFSELVISAFLCENGDLELTIRKHYHSDRLLAKSVRIGLADIVGEACSPDSLEPDDRKQLASLLRELANQLDAA